MRRREFIGLLGGAAAGRALPANAQQSSRAARILVIGGGIDEALSAGPGYQEFLAELQKLGFTEGRNATVRYIRTESDPDKLQAEVAAAVRAGTSVIVASGAELALKAAVAASPEIPIVTIASNFDPIARGYVASLARPGGNVTGVIYRQPEIAQKRVELLKETFPQKVRLGVLWDAGSAESFASAEQTARTLNLQYLSMKLERPPYDFDAAFRWLAAQDAQMLLVLSSRFFARASSRVIELATRIAYRVCSSSRHGRAPEG
jgi:ABC transporter substrate binding protein